MTREQYDATDDRVYDVSDVTASAARATDVTLDVSERGHARTPRRGLRGAAVGQDHGDVRLRRRRHGRRDRRRARGAVAGRAGVRPADRAGHRRSGTPRTRSGSPAWPGPQARAARARPHSFSRLRADDDAGRPRGRGRAGRDPRAGRGLRASQPSTDLRPAGAWRERSPRRGPSCGRRWPSLLLGLFAAVLLWWTRGRDRGTTARSRVRPLLDRGDGSLVFAPPSAVRPGQMGTLVDERADVVDVASTVIDLAVRNYLFIEELPRRAVRSRRLAAAQAQRRRRRAAALRARGLRRGLRRRRRRAGQRPRGACCGRGCPASRRCCTTTWSGRVGSASGRMRSGRRWTTAGWVLVAAGVVLTGVLALVSTFGLVGVGVVLAGVALAGLGQVAPARTVARQQGAARAAGVPGVPRSGRHRRHPAASSGRSWCRGSTRTPWCSASATAGPTALAGDGRRRHPGRAALLVRRARRTGTSPTPAPPCRHGAGAQLRHRLPPPPRHR